MVVTALSPMLSMVVIQERIASPSTCTVQAPHSAAPHPNLVPVMPSTSRNTQSKGVSASTSTLCAVPLTLTEKAIGASSVAAGPRADDDSTCGNLLGPGCLVLSRLAQL